MLRTCTLIFVSLLASVLITTGRSNGQTVTFYGTDAVAPGASVFDMVEYPIPQMTPVGTTHFSSNTLSVIIAPNMVLGSKTDIFQNYSLHVSGMALTHYAAMSVGGDIGAASANYADGNIVYLPDSGTYVSFASDPYAVSRATVADVDASFGADLWGYAMPEPGHPATIIATVQGSGVTTYAYTFLPSTPYAGGDWDGDGETSLPNGSGATAVFPSTAAGTVSVSGVRTIGNWLIDAASPYTFNGPGSITLSQDGHAQVSVAGSTTHAVNANVALASDTSFYVHASSRLSMLGMLSVGSASSAISKVGGGTLAIPAITISSVRVMEGRLAANNSGTVTRTGQLVILGEQTTGAGTTQFVGGALDLATVGSALIVDYDGANAMTPIGGYSDKDSLAYWIKNGFNSGSWSGAPTDASGRKLGVLTSSSAAADSDLGVGFAEAHALYGSSGGTFLGQSVDGSTALARVTLRGDVNLDGTVNITDSGIVGSNYNTTGKLWWEGDFDYDGDVDIGDYSAMASNYNSSLPSSGARGSVPEPASILLSGPLIALALARRR